MAPRRPPQHLRRLLLSLVVGAHSLICTPALSSGGALRDQPCAHLRRTGAVSMGFFSEMFDELDRFIVCRGTSNQPRPSQHGSHSSPLLAAGPTYLRAARCVSAELSCSCVRVAHVCRTTLRAGGSATARSSTGSAGSSLCCLAAIDIAAVPYARGTRTGLPRRAWLRRRQLGACRLRTACRGTAGPPYTKPDPDPDQVLLLRRGGREPQGSPRRREP